MVARGWRGFCGSSRGFRVDEKVVYAVGTACLQDIDGWRTNAPLTISTTEFPNYLMPVVTHPANHLVLYAGLGNVYRSTDAGASWQRLSNFPDTNTPLPKDYPGSVQPNVIYVTRGPTSGGPAMAACRGRI